MKIEARSLSVSRSVSQTHLDGNTYQPKPENRHDNNNRSNDLIIFVSCCNNAQGSRPGQAGTERAAHAHHAREIGRYLSRKYTCTCKPICNGETHRGRSINRWEEEHERPWTFGSEATSVIFYIGYQRERSFCFARAAVASSS